MSSETILSELKSNLLVFDEAFEEEIRANLLRSMDKLIESIPQKIKDDPKLYDGDLAKGLAEICLKLAMPGENLYGKAMGAKTLGLIAKDHPEEARVVLGMLKEAMSGKGNYPRPRDPRDEDFVTLSAQEMSACIVENRRELADASLLKIMVGSAVKPFFAHPEKFSSMFEDYPLLRASVEEHCWKTRCAISAVIVERPDLAAGALGNLDEMQDAADASNKALKETDPEASKAISFIRAGVMEGVDHARRAEKSRKIFNAAKSFAVCTAEGIKDSVEHPGRSAKKVFVHAKDWVSKLDFDQI